MVCIVGYVRMEDINVSDEMSVGDIELGMPRHGNSDGLCATPFRNRKLRHVPRSAATVHEDGKRRKHGEESVKQLTLEITQGCPNNCLLCSSLSHSGKDVQIPTGKAVEVIDGMARIGFNLLCISGGEPFLHDGLSEIVGHARRLGIGVYIYTSGVCVGVSGTPHGISRKMMDSMAGMGVDKMIFNFPAADGDVWDMLTGTRGHMAYTEESIRNSVGSGMHTEFHFVPTKLNMDQIEKVVEYAAGADVERVSFLKLIPQGRACRNMDILVPDASEYRMIKEKLYRMKTAYGDMVRIGNSFGTGVCTCGTEKLVVRYDGKVFGCEAYKQLPMYDAQGNEILPDSIYERDIADIYAGSEHMDSERNGRPACGNIDACVE